MEQFITRQEFSEFKKDMDNGLNEQNKCTQKLHSDIMIKSVETYNKLSLFWI